MTGEIVRIGLRYLAMFLIAKGVFSPEIGNAITTDPQLATLIETGIGAVMAGGTEVWFAIVKRWKLRKEAVKDATLVAAVKEAVVAKQELAAVTGQVQS